MLTDHPVVLVFLGFWEVLAVALRSLSVYFESITVWTCLRWRRLLFNPVLFSVVMPRVSF